MVDKQEARRKALVMRNALSKEERKEKSAIIEKKIVQSKDYKRAKIVLSYMAFRSEVETDSLNRRVLEDGKKLYLPKTYEEERQMRFFAVAKLSDLVTGYQGIQEPLESTDGEAFLEEGKYNREDVLMLMPGVAFDEAGNRMGYGGGYYDRYLTQYGGKMISILLAFEEQKTQELPTEACDMKPECIMTQEKCRRRERI